MSYLKNFRYNYKGYYYCPEEDREPDNIKIFHTVFKGEFVSTVHNIPFTPYGFPSEEAFKAWIDSGLPTREQINMAISGSNVANPSEQDIINYYIEHVLVK